MSKFFVTNNQIKDQHIEILGEDVNHIVNVLRLRKEDEIIIGDKEHHESYQVKIIETSKEKVICEILNKIQETTESIVDVTIFQGLPKAEKMEYIIQKATELGVKKIVPVAMKRCIVKLNGKDEQKKIARWQKIAEVAAKQSGRDVIPEIGNIQNINAIIEEIEKYDLFIVAYENEKEQSLKKELIKLKKEKFDYTRKLNIGVVIGPEGGIELSEVEVLKQNGSKVVSLGSRILRTETVALAVLSNIMYEFE